MISALCSMTDVFNPKRISPDCIFKSNHRQVKKSILFPRCAIYLHGMLHTAEIVSVVCTEIISTVWCTPRISFCDRISRWNRNRIRKYFRLFKCLSGAQKGSNHEKQGSKISWHTPFTPGSRRVNLTKMVWGGVKISWHCSFLKVKL